MIQHDFNVVTQEDVFKIMNSKNTNYLDKVKTGLTYKATCFNFLELIEKIV